MKTKGFSLIFTLAVFGLGFLAGLQWASHKGPPPGLLQAGPAPGLTAQDRQTLAWLEENITRNHGQAEPLIQAGNWAFDRELYEKAIGFYKSAAQLAPENPDLLTDLGVALRRTGKPEEALAMFERARAADPGHVSSAFNMGIVLLHDLKNEKAAITAWEAFLTLEPEGRAADMVRKVIENLTASNP